MSEKVELFYLSKMELLAGIARILKDYKVAALTKDQGMPKYDYINQAGDIEFSCVPTVLSPKKFFFPAEEELLTYETNGKMHTEIAAQPLVIFGLHPCDLHALKILDEAFAEANGDPNYLAKREQGIIVGLDCKSICDKRAFCYRVASQEIAEGFDLMLYPLAEDFLLRVGSKKGNEFYQRYFKVTTATEKMWEEYARAKEQGFSQKHPFRKLEQFPEIFANNEDHSFWQKEGSRCLSCGSCIMVCPTCYCFDVSDELDLNLQGGKRTRKWDACMLSDFAVVAGGENFRHSATERLQHRINRKFNYLMRKHERSVCVGCGRCVRACLADINPQTIAETIADEKE